MNTKRLLARLSIVRAAAMLFFGIASAAVHAGNNFTMLDSTGAPVGGTNDVAFTWDRTLNTSVNTAVVNATLSSSTPFFGLNWTAYNVKIYGPGTYAISTVDTAGGPGCPTVAPANCASGGTYTVTVASNQIMAHMKFAWGGTEGIDVVDVWQPGDWTTLNPGSSIWTGAGGTYQGPVFSFTSIDWDGDGRPGAGMIDGPFPNFNANFNVNTNVNAGGGGVVGRPEVTDAPTTGTAGGGCTLAAKITNPLERGDWWLVVGFIAWLAVIRRRHRRSLPR